MAESKKGGRKKAGVPPEEIYEADDYELVPDEEKHAGQRYDVSITHYVILSKINCTTLVDNVPIYISPRTGHVRRLTWLIGQYSHLSDYHWYTRKFLVAL